MGLQQEGLHIRHKCSYITLTSIDLTTSSDWSWSFIATERFRTQLDGTTGEHRSDSFVSPLIWVGNKLRHVHHVDHIDGDLTDSEARRSLCPNCHYCRETTGGRFLTSVAEVGSIIRGSTQTPRKRSKSPVPEGQTNSTPKKAARANALGGGVPVTQVTTFLTCSQRSGCSDTTGLRPSDKAALVPWLHG